MINDRNRIIEISNAYISIWFIQLNTIVLIHTLILTMVKCKSSRIKKRWEDMVEPEYQKVLCPFLRGTQWLIQWIHICSNSYPNNSDIFHLDCSQWDLKCWSDQLLNIGFHTDTSRLAWSLLILKKIIKKSMIKKVPTRHNSSSYVSKHDQLDSGFSKRRREVIISKYILS